MDEKLPASGRGNLYSSSASGIHHRINEYRSDGQNIKAKPWLPFHLPQPRDHPGGDGVRPRLQVKPPDPPERSGNWNNSARPPGEAASRSEPGWFDREESPSRRGGDAGHYFPPSRIRNPSTPRREPGRLIPRFQSNGGRGEKRSFDKPGNSSTLALSL